MSLIRWRKAFHKELIEYINNVEKQVKESPPSEEEPSNADAEIGGPGAESGDFLHVQDHNTADMGEEEFLQIITDNQYYFACHADLVEGYFNSTETCGLDEQHLQGLSHGKGKPSSHRPRGSTRRRRKEKQADSRSSWEALRSMEMLAWQVDLQLP